jgi:hypothetical protein
MSVETLKKWSFFDYRILIILATFAILNPSEADHDKKVYYLLGAYTFGGYTNSEQKIHNYTTRVNFVFFSLTEINSYKILRNGYSSDIIGIGFLGNVIIFNNWIQA